jgi:hypothetical protein
MMDRHLPASRLGGVFSSGRQGEGAAAAEDEKTENAGVADLVLDEYTIFGH